MEMKGFSIGTREYLIKGELPNLSNRLDKRVKIPKGIDLTQKWPGECYKSTNIV